MYCITFGIKLDVRALFAGTSVATVTATDADDQTYGNSAKLVYSILQGQPYFSVDSENGKPNPAGFLMSCKCVNRSLAPLCVLSACQCCSSLQC